MFCYSNKYLDVSAFPKLYLNKICIRIFNFTCESAIFSNYFWKWIIMMPMMVTMVIMMIITNNNDNGYVRLCVTTCYPRYLNHLNNVNKMRYKTEIIIIQYNKSSYNKNYNIANKSWQKPNRYCFGCKVAFKSFTFNNNAISPCVDYGTGMELKITYIGKIPSRNLTMTLLQPHVLIPLLK